MASKYRKVSPIEHVLLRPEMYLGSVEDAEERMWVALSSGEFVFGHYNVNHGLLKIFDEILLNASDNVAASKKTPQTYINITIDEVTGAVTISNDGSGIPIVKSREHQLMIPEMVFGHLLTSSHYDKEMNSLVAGRHGYGAKLTNIMSTEFSVHCICGGKSYKQSWSNNMRTAGSQDISTTEEKDMTSVTFTPDFKQFNCEKWSADMKQILRKRCIDLSVELANTVQVTFNGQPLTSDFVKYAKKYIPKEKRQENFVPYVFENPKVKFALCPSFIKLKTNVSGVNGVVTSNGGKHLDNYHQQALAAAEAFAAQKSTSKVRVSPNALLKMMTIVAFVKAGNPKFDSQSKVRLVSDHSFPKLNREELVQYFSTLPDISFAMEHVHSTIAKQMKNTVKPTIAIPKLVDAVNVGKDTCTLILTEGDSAKSLALSSLSLAQREKYGVFPLRGKILNVRVSENKLATCKELKDLFHAVGLVVGKPPDENNLRYQHVMIMTDQDVDGSHIRGLLISALLYLWPTIAQMRNFLNIFNTPLLKVFFNDGTVLPFFQESEFSNWANENPGLMEKGRVKYYKGLGTSTTAEGREYFSAVDQHIARIKLNSDRDNKCLSRVFLASEVDWRKKWITDFDPKLAQSPLTKDSSGRFSLTIPDFIDKELIHYAVADNNRSIPSLIDGLKVSQRKVLWAMLHRSSQVSARVAQLSGYISEHSKYHHGEASLQQTIVKMAQDFTGSNNIPFLVPEGQFGSRLLCGQDSAAPRYIFTKVAPCTRLLFPAEDDAVLQYRTDDETLVEPEYFVPVIPTLLVNGSLGIGTGFQCSIPPYHPLQLIHACREMIGGTPSKKLAHKLVPHAVGYLGQVKRLSEGHYMMNGLYQISLLKEKYHIRVTEIPWPVSIESFRERLSSLAEAGRIDKFVDYSGPNHIDIDIVVPREILDTFLENSPEASVFQFLSLQRSVTVNATAFNARGQLQESGLSIAPVLDAHFECRMETYQKRKDSLINATEKAIEELRSVEKFTLAVQSGKLQLSHMSLEDLEAFCQKAELATRDNSHQYLLNRSIATLTKTNVDKLRSQLASKKSDLDNLKNATPSSMWLDELKVLEQHLEGMITEQTDFVKKEVRARHYKPVGAAVPELAALHVKTLPTAGSLIMSRLLLQNMTAKALAKRLILRK